MSADDGDDADDDEDDDDDDEDEDDDEDDDEYFGFNLKLMEWLRHQSLFL